jgi:hypothetical protein
VRNTRVVLLLLAGATCLTACVAPEEPEAARRSALGEPTNGFPTAAERLGIMAINRARSDPQTVKGAASAAYPARPPVLWSYTLSRSSRFHATNLRLTGVSLMHSSPCALNTNVATAGCAGDPACACATPVPAMCASCATVAAVNTCGTDPFVRIGFFTAGTTTGANGEVAAAGYADPMSVVDGWMDEASGADGHRRNLTDQGITSNSMGYGHAEGAACFSTFDVSDSGNMTGATIPKLPTAAVRGPANNGAGSYAFYATWADPALGAPASLTVVIDGACTAMAREMGTDTLNATYKASSTLAAGCHNYFMVARDKGGAALTYPTTGAITIPVGSATACATDFLTTAPAATCVADGGAPPPPIDAGVDLPRADAGVDRGAGSGGANGAGGSGGSTAGAGGSGAAGSGGGGSITGSGGANGGGGNPGSGGSGGPMTDAGNGSPDGPAPPSLAVNGGCSCDASGGGSPSLAGGSLVSLALLIGARRRRRAR